MATNIQTTSLTPTGGITVPAVVGPPPPSPLPATPQQSNTPPATTTALQTAALQAAGPPAPAPALAPAAAPPAAPQAAGPPAAAAPPQPPIPPPIPVPFTVAQDPSRYAGWKETNWKPWNLDTRFLALLIVIHSAQLWFLVFIATRTADYPPFTFSQDAAGVYFAWQFVPIIIAVILGRTWGSVHRNVAELEPFYQLSTQYGTTAAVLAGRFHGRWAFWTPRRAGKARLWAVLLSSSIHLLAFSAIPILASMRWQVDFGVPSDQGIWVPSVQVNVGYLIPSIICEAAVIILAITLTVMLAHRKSGVVSDPGGLAGLAALVADSPDFCKMLLDPENPIPSRDALMSRLRGFQLRLAYVFVPDATPAPAPPPNTPAPPPGTRLAYQIYLSFIPPHLQQPTRTHRRPVQVRDEGRLRMLRLRVLFAYDIFVTLPFIATVLLIISLNGTLNIPAFNMLVTFVFVVYSSVHDMVEADLRMIAPFFALRDAEVAGCDGHAQAKASRKAVLTDYGHLSRSTRNGGHSWAWLIRTSTISGFMILAYTTTIPNLIGPLLSVYNEYIKCMLAPQVCKPERRTLLEQLQYGNRPAYPVAMRTLVGVVHWCSYITVLFVLGNSTAIGWNRRHPIVPRCPDSVLSNLGYLAGSGGLLKIVRGTELMDPTQRKDHVERLAANQWLRFDFAWFEPKRLGIDVSPGLGRYTYGDVDGTYLSV